MDFQKRVTDFITKNNMIDLGDEVVLGLSGGADSVALFFVLLEYKKTLAEKYNESFSLRCVYVHHMIREDADRDVELVERLCAGHDIPLAVEKRDVSAEAKKTSQTLEEAGRKIRYGIFEEYASRAESRGKRSRIAVAHHMDDQAETVLFNLTRGTGISGICGMQPVTGNIIRPLLCVTKSDILDHVKKLGQEYIVDSTNSDKAYSRNRLRNETIPSLRLINEKAVEHIASAAEKFSAIESFVMRSVSAEYEKCVKECEYKGTREFHLSVERYDGTEPELKDMLVRQMLVACAQRSKDIEQVHVNSVRRLIDSSSGRLAELPYGMTAHRTGDEIVLRRGSEKMPDLGQDFTLEVLDINDVDEISRGDDGRIIVEKKECTIFCDYDKITGQVYMRNILPEDEMVIDSSGHRKKVSRMFIDMKVPAYKRGDYCAICDAEKILWIPGLRDTYACRVDKDTRRVAVIKVSGI